MRHFARFEKSFEEKELPPAIETSDFVLKLRAVKDDVEIEAMKAAQAITDAAFEHIVSFMRVGMTEREVQLELEEAMRRLGGRRPRVLFDRGFRSQRCRSAQHSGRKGS